MSAESKREFCREWYARGECPGCGAPLVKVAGEGLGHWLPGQTVLTKNGPKVSQLGEVYKTIGSGRVRDSRRCRFTADDLTSLVLIGSGLVSDRSDRCVSGSGASRTAPQPEPLTEPVGSSAALTLSRERHERLPAVAPTGSPSLDAS